MKIALITDTHFGARNDSQVFAAYFKKFYDNVFFPYLEENNIDTIIHLGDIVDRRKFINYLSIRNFRDSFLFPALKKNVHLIIGNHDTYFKNTNDVNSMRELLPFPQDNINYYSSAAEIDFDGCKILLMPWINSGNYAESMAAMQTTKADIMFGHFEIQGFEMYKNSFNDHGFETSIFSKFDMVCSGHFHHKSSRENIHYLGAPYQMTWSDFGDFRGFHIFDTSDRSLEYILNPYTIFNKVFYDDSEKSLDDMLEDLSVSAHNLHNSYVKVIIKQKTNPYNFDLYIDNLEKIGIENIQIVDDHLNLDLEDDSDIGGDVEDTVSFLKHYVDQLDFKVAKPKITNLLTNLYNEALAKE
jgi:DNA repair exonuclease SbcCD nuclease subunit